MPRVLITGAAGFIGMHTSIRFLREGWDVVGLDNMNDYYCVALKRARLKEIEKEAMKRAQSFAMFEADLNSNVWHELVNIDFDAVIHLAAQAGVRYSIENPKAYLESNILGFQSVLEFVENQQIYRFVYASSSSVYGKSSKQPFSESEPCNHPESYYAATKISNELDTKVLNSIPSTDMYNKTYMYTLNRYRNLILTEAKKFNIETHYVDLYLLNRMKKHYFPILQENCDKIAAIPLIEQKTPAWFKQRETMISASDAGYFLKKCGISRAIETLKIKLGLKKYVKSIS